MVENSAIGHGLDERRQDAKDTNVQVHVFSAVFYHGYKPTSLPSNLLNLAIAIEIESKYQIIVEYVHFVI